MSTHSVTDPAAHRTVAEFDDYTDALRAAELLTDEGIPADKVRIVGYGLRSIEPPTAAPAHAGLLGAIEGALIGALFGLLMGLTSSSEPDVGLPVLLLYGLFWGAVLGGVLAALPAAVAVPWRSRPRGGWEAARYEVAVDAGLAERAEHILDGTRVSGPKGEP